jgi:glyoxylase-like metal-dependent hydrolase (beta-lactamase superfamily II)
MRLNQIFGMAVSVLALFGMVSVVGQAARAAAPFAKTNAPGFYRFFLGDVEVTAISDGTVPLPVETLLTNTTPDQVKAMLAKSFLTSPVEGSVNSFLINTGTKLILIDTGAGGLFGPTLGHFVANLKASGYQPEQVDEIYITHFHADHIGGLATNGVMNFPNAIFRADFKELGFWLDEGNKAKVPKELAPTFDAVKAMVGPYQAAGKIKPIETAGALADGISARPSHGHTPGHMSYVIESKGKRLVLIGDMIHVGAVQFEHPEITIAFDSDSKAAEAERKATFASSAKNGELLGAAHISFPGLFHLRASGKSFVSVPVNYEQIH